MLNEIKKIVELTSMNDIDFITLKEEGNSLQCLFVTDTGSFNTLLITQPSLVNELKSHAIANIIYGNQATRLLLRLYSWIKA